MLSCYTYMLQVYSSKCSSCFRCMLQAFYLDIAYVSHICCKCFIWMLHMLHTYVASVSSGCCIYCHGYTRMLQVIVPNILVVSDVRCKCFIWLLHMFHTYVASVLSRYCICFTHMLQVCYLDGACVWHIFCKCFIWICICLTHMLQVFHLNVSYFCSGYTCFPDILDVCCKCFDNFGRMLQVFYLDITKVDLVCSGTCCSGTHLSQQPAAAARPTCMHVGVEGARAAGAGNGAGVDKTRHRVGTRRHEKQSSVGPHMKQVQACGWA
jgi:hypothetical protein